MSRDRPVAEGAAAAGVRRIDLTELEQRREAWARLARETALPTAYGSPGWLLAWLRAYGDDAEPRFFALDGPDGALLGLAPLVLTRSRGVRTLGFAAEEWNGIDVLLARPEHEQAFTDGLLAALAQRSAEWDLLRVRRLPLESLLAERLLNGPAPLRAGAHDVRLQPYLELPATVEAFEARFGSKQRSTQRRKWRKLLESGAAPRLVTDADEIAPAVHTLLELRRGRARAMGQRYAHMDERFERFMVDAIRQMSPDGARLWVLESGGEVLATRLNFAEGPREHSYILGLSDEQTALSPGSGIERHAIFEAIGEGRTEFDLGPGRDEYKYRLGGIDRELTRLVVGSRSPRGRLLGAAAALDVKLRDSGPAARLRERRGMTPERATAELPRVERPADAARG